MSCLTADSVNLSVWTFEADAPDTFTQLPIRGLEGLFYAASGERYPGLPATLDPFRLSAWLEPRAKDAQSAEFFDFQLYNGGCYVLMRDHLQQNAVVLIRAALRRNEYHAGSRTIRVPSDGKLIRAAMSRDGRRLAYLVVPPGGSGVDVWTSSTTGRLMKRVVRIDRPGMSNANYYPDLRWLPGGAGLSFTEAHRLFMVRGVDTNA